MADGTEKLMITTSRRADGTACFGVCNFVRIRTEAVRNGNSILDLDYRDGNELLKVVRQTVQMQEFGFERLKCHYAVGKCRSEQEFDTISQHFLLKALSFSCVLP